MNCFTWPQAYVRCVSPPPPDTLSLFLKYYCFSTDGPNQRLPGYCLVQWFVQWFDASLTPKMQNWLEDSDWAVTHARKIAKVSPRMFPRLFFHPLLWPGKKGSAEAAAVGSPPHLYPPSVFALQEITKAKTCDAEYTCRELCGFVVVLLHNTHANRGKSIMKASQASIINVFFIIQRDQS